MSRAEVLPAVAPPAPAPVAFGRLLRSELRLVLGRRRNQVLLAGLALVPVVIGTVLLVGALTFIPALALGPVAEHFSLL